MLMMLCNMKIESLMKYKKKKIDIKVETTCIKFYTL